MNHSNSPVQNSIYWRSRAVATLIVLTWTVLAGRLVQLQWFAQVDLANRGTRQRFLHETIVARPGEILDRHGRVLATTVRSSSLFVVPNRITDAQPIADRLAELLGLNSEVLRARFEEHCDKHFLWVKRRLTQPEVAAIKSSELPSDAYGFRDEFLRRYPSGKLAAHVLGIRDIDGRGRGGIEQSFDAILSGKQGRRRLARDAHGRILDVEEEIEEAPQPGKSVVLTIDSVVQLHTERHLEELVKNWQPKGATAIVIDPTNGELLAMASRPTFDPNAPEEAKDTDWKNNAIASIYEPGSTFKPMVVAAAIDHDRIAFDDTFHCEWGVYRMGPRILHDHHKYGELSVTDILVKSSNIGMAKIGERLGNAGLFDAAVLFGFGRKTGIRLPGELAGMLRPLKQWNSYSTGSIPMGQEIAVTPIQLITAHAALANGGRLLRPQIVLENIDTSIRPPSENAYQTDVATRVVSRTVSSDVARWIVRKPMSDVVRRGTGRKAQLDDYAVFGKTGTAQKPDPVTGSYSSRLHVSSFVAGAPAENPRVLVLVVVDEPSVGGNHYGGTVAAPAATEILRKTLIHLRVPPSNRERTARSNPARPTETR